MDSAMHVCVRGTVKFVHQPYHLFWFLCSGAVVKIYKGESVYLHGKYREVSPYLFYRL